MKSCEDCYFNSTNGLHSAQLGGPVCLARKGPLFVPLYNRAQNERLREAKASRCEEYTPSGNSPPAEVTPARNAHEAVAGTLAFLPDPSVRTESGGAEPPIRSCLQCKFYISPEAMAERGLWPVAACAARGILLGGNKLAQAAATCTVQGRIGPRDLSVVDRLQIVPEYTITSIGKLTTAHDFIRDSEVKFIEPSTYETDAEVSASERVSGVRAWRKIESPDKNNSILLPLFDPEYFTEAERDAIPMTGDDEHPEEYVDHMGLVYKAAVLWMGLDETPALHGEAGTGKTEFFRHIAWIMGLPFHRISVTASTEVDDLAGKMHYSPERGTYFEYGRIPQAWTRPGVICLDEPNVGQPDVWHFIRPLTDNSKQLVLDMNEGERVKRHDFAFLGMAMNPHWDARNSGAESLADADGSRLMHIFVDLPDELTERKIIFNRVLLDGWEITDEQLDIVMRIAADLRAMSKDGSLPITWGIRPQIKVARALKWFSPQEAYRLAAADHLEPQSQEQILDAVRSHVRTMRKASNPKASSPKGRST